eukprot:CAMPEP_0184647124 /NCGR_PEP_ID=MMETSP0308-20130426/4030_1 /TAXON_ID=38269 /ORGANISM="Gloeochaete witrockiana, Strain SAG 46.84" /LENGTH=301 /DNA_ID=CAMNT_0027077873 /DNA_START=157 /DNA_END=1062 /DNA_ORIENTATION=-
MTEKRLWFALSIFGSLLILQDTHALQSERIHLRGAAAQPTTAPTTEAPPTSPLDSTPTSTPTIFSDEDDKADDDIEECGSEDEDDVVYLTRLEPFSGSVLGGQEVHVYGYGFPDAPMDEDYSNPPLKCNFDEIRAKVISWSNQYVLCISPEHPAGVASVTITITNKTQVVDPLHFFFTAALTAEAEPTDEEAMRAVESKRIHLRAAAAEPTTAPTTEVPPTSPPESTPTRTSDDYSDEDESEAGLDETLPWCSKYVKHVRCNPPPCGNDEYYDDDEHISHVEDVSGREDQSHQLVGDQSQS